MTTRELIHDKCAAPVSLFMPDMDALGKIHIMSFNKDGVLVDCRMVKPDYISGIRWLMRHYEWEG